MTRTHILQFTFALYILLFAGALAQDGRFQVQHIFDLPESAGIDYGVDGNLYVVSCSKAGYRRSLLTRVVLDDQGIPDPNSKATLYTWPQGDEAVGLKLDPTATPENMVAYVTVSNYGKGEWGGRVEEVKFNGVTGTFISVRSIITGLAIGFHQVNQINIGPDRHVYISAGSTTTSGMPGQYSNEYQEKPLSAALLRGDLQQILAQAPLNVQTSGGNNYNPNTANSPLKTYGLAIRNPFDSLWHSNGRYYATTNQNDVNGQTGTCGGLPNLLNQRPDEWLSIIVEGYTYGFPNPSRGECVLAGGNPTGGADPFEVGAYPVGVTPPPTFHPEVMHDIADIGGGSADGMIEYLNEGVHKGRIIITFYGPNGGGKIWAFTTDPQTGKIIAQEKLKDENGNDVVIPDCLNLVEHPSKGHIYVARYGDQGDNGGAGGLYFLRRVDPLPAGSVTSVSLTDIRVNVNQGTNPGTSYWFDVWNGGASGDNMAYTVDSNVPWITVAPANGNSLNGRQRKPHKVDVTTNNMAPGDYEGVITVEGAGQPRQVTVHVHVGGNAAPVNKEPIVDAGEAKTITIQPNELPYTLNMAGTINDDGLPDPPAKVAVEWTVSDASPSLEVTILEPNNIKSPVRFDSYGQFILVLKADDGAKSAVSQVTITIDQPNNQAPTVTMTASHLTIVLPSPVRLTAEVTDDGLPNPPSQIFYTWARVETGVGIANFTNEHENETLVYFSEPSSYLLQITVSDGAKTASAHLVVNALPEGTPLNLTATTAGTTSSFNTNTQIFITDTQNNLGTNTIDPSPSTHDDLESPIDMSASGHLGQELLLVNTVTLLCGVLMPRIFNMMMR